MIHPYFVAWDMLPPAQLCEPGTGMDSMSHLWKKKSSLSIKCSNTSNDYLNSLIIQTWPVGFISPFNGTITPTLLQYNEWFLSVCFFCTDFTFFFFRMRKIIYLDIIASCSDVSITEDLISPHLGQLTQQGARVDLVHVHFLIRHSGETSAINW